MIKKIFKWLHYAFFSIGICTVVFLAINAFVPSLCIHVLQFLVISVGIGAIIEAIIHEYKLFSGNYIIRNIICVVIGMGIMLLISNFFHFSFVSTPMGKILFWVKALIGAVIGSLIICAVYEFFRVKGLKEINQKLEKLSDKKQTK